MVHSSFNLRLIWDTKSRVGGNNFGGFWSLNQVTEIMQAGSRCLKAYCVWPFFVLFSHYYHILYSQFEKDWSALIKMCNTQQQVVIVTRFSAACRLSGKQVVFPRQRRPRGGSIKGEQGSHCSGSSEKRSGASHATWALSTVAASCRYNSRLSVVFLFRGWKG